MGNNLDCGRQLDDCKAAIAAHNVVTARLIDEHAAFISRFHKLAAERSAVIEEFQRTHENLFTGILPLIRRKEEFHSEMLKKFLYPKKSEIGDKRFLRVFLELLKKINPQVETGGFDGQITVEREASGENGRIDLFIYSETHAVIIENKINNAKDQHNQLARYVAQSSGKEVSAVVYIPLFEDGKPPLDYDKEWQKYIPEIKQKLVILPAINRRRKDEQDTNANDIAYSFIGGCLKLEGITEPQRYMLSQYAKLLLTMEGESKMTETIDMEFIKEFYKDKKSIETLEHMNDVWNERNELLSALVCQSAWDKLKKDFGFYENEEYPSHLFKDVSDGMCIFLYHDDDNNLHLGFWYKNKINEKVKS
ncbi:MAG: PD-(D/E)XK nuclease family protein, partial [Spirochaetaceae bacterium]|nr:PD-(D/E)XK nuclease family protein [Spirochaetaceae bacterium]